MEDTQLENPDAPAHLPSEIDTASSSCSNQNVETGKASPKLENTTLVATLSNAAVEGNTDPPDQSVTPNKNKILHVHITTRSKKELSLDFETEILKMCPDLLRQVSNRDETLLHVIIHSGASTCSSSNQNGETDKPTPELVINKDIDSLYYGAVEGEIEPFKEYKEPLDQLVTPNKNTILHIYITAPSKKEFSLEDCFVSIFKRFLNWRICYFLGLIIYVFLALISNLWGFISRKTPGDRLKFVEEILNRCPGLLWKVNNKDETLLHIAARHGLVDIVDLLFSKCKETHQNDQEKGIGAAKEMLRMTNTAKDTAMHEAVRYHHQGVVKRLMQEDPNFAYEANVAGESQLYLAAERGYSDIVYQIVFTWRPLAYGGPKGRTALHAAVLRNDFASTWLILLTNEDLKTKKDEKGWIPLHYAADYGYVEIVRLLLHIDKLAAYFLTDNGKKTALHIAASRGNVDIMKVIISSCPGCSELVDVRGWNVFHFAMESRNSNAVKLILEDPSLSNLINERNNDGNTPLHQLAALGFCMKSFIGHPKVDKLAFNKQNYNALDITLGKDDALSRTEKYLMYCLKDNGIREGRRVEVNKDEGNSKGNDPYKDGDVIANSRETREAHSEQASSSYDKKGKNKYSEIIANIKKAREAHLVVATLIATVTFAAGFTVPGGFKGEGSPDQGTAILTRSAAFKAFVITNTIAMMLSSSAVFLQLFMALDRDKGRIISKFIHELQMTIFAMFAMVVAFITGTYAVLAPSSWLAIATCVIGSIFFLLYGYLISEYILDLIDILKAKIKIRHSSRVLEQKVLSLMHKNKDQQFSMSEKEIANFAELLINSQSLMSSGDNIVKKVKETVQSTDKSKVEKPAPEDLNLGPSSSTTKDFTTAK